MCHLDPSLRVSPLWTVSGALSASALSQAHVLRRGWPRSMGLGAEDVGFGDFIPKQSGLALNRVAQIWEVGIPGDLDTPRSQDVQALLSVVGR